mmetsp:Transcript_22739/g.44327  ORF Transcript_22739/g.44327 Transcript_22739/m.44327 type:complete len:238 (+) Transcript_22739:1699-2412(+)
MILWGPWFSLSDVWLRHHRMHATWSWSWSWSLMGNASSHSIRNVPHTSHHLGGIRHLEPRSFNLLSRQINPLGLLRGSRSGRPPSTRAIHRRRRSSLLSRPLRIAHVPHRAWAHTRLPPPSRIAVQLLLCWKLIPTLLRIFRSMTLPSPSIGSSLVSLVLHSHRSLNPISSASHHFWMHTAVRRYSWTPHSSISFILSGHCCGLCVHLPKGSINLSLRMASPSIPVLKSSVIYELFV